MLDGKFVGARPSYGYLKDPQDCHHLVVDPETAPVVRQIFSWAAGGCSAAEISRRLFAQNVPTPAQLRVIRGKPHQDVSRSVGVWPNTTVLRMLADEQYIGTYIQGRAAVREIGSGSVRRKDRSEWFILPDHHEPIVSRELFEAANAKIRRSPAPGKTPREYPLRGKVYCGYCAHAMSRVNGRWFVCPYRKGYGRPGCTGLSVRAEELEQIVFDSLRQQMAASLGMDTETNVFRVSSCKQAELEKRLQSIRQRKRELYEQFVTEKIPLDDFQAEKQRCDREAQALRNTLKMLAARQQEMQENREASTRFNTLREEVLSSGSLTQAIAEKLIKKVTVYHDRQIEIEFAVQDFLKAEGSAPAGFAG